MRRERMSVTSSTRKHERRYDERDRERTSEERDSGGGFVKGGKKYIYIIKREREE